MFSRSDRKHSQRKKSPRQVRRQYRSCRRPPAETFHAPQPGAETNAFFRAKKYFRTASAFIDEEREDHRLKTACPITDLHGHRTSRHGDSASSVPRIHLNARATRKLKKNNDLSYRHQSHEWLAKPRRRPEHDALYNRNRFPAVLWFHAICPKSAGGDSRRPSLPGFGACRHTGTPVLAPNVPARSCRGFHPCLCRTRAGIPSKVGHAQSASSETSSFSYYSMS